MDNMAVKLRIIEICDFKTFIGKWEIGPLKEWTAIVAPNGSGKSNVIDAIAFGFGEQQNHHLRIKHLCELVPQGNSQFNRTSVSLTISAKKKGEKIFTRTLVKTGDVQYESAYWINGKITEINNYLGCLKDYGIDIAAKDFLVYQGKINDIIKASPRERTELFERVSGSIEFKKPYNECIAEMKKNDEKLKVFNNDKHQLLQTVKNLQKEIDTINEANQKRKELELKSKEYYLLQLRINDLHNETVNQEEVAANASLELYGRQDESNVQDQTLLPSKIDAKKKQLEEAMKQLEALDFQLSLKNNERSMYDNEIKKLENYIQAGKKRQEDLAGIEQAIGANQDLQRKFSLELKEYDDITSENLSEYERLLRDINEQIVFSRPLNDLNWLKRNFNERIGFLKQKLNTCNLWINDKQNILAIKNQTLKKVATEIENTVNAMKKLEEKIREKSQGALTNEERERLMERKQEINAQLGNRQMSIVNEQRMARQYEVLRKLREQFPDKVHGRVYSLCKAVHSQYRVAVATAMGGKMNVIVVEDDATAGKCLKYLREQKMECETIHSIEGVRRIDTDRRFDQGKLQNVRFLYDFVKFDEKYQPIIDNIVKSTLICETLEEAWTVWDAAPYKHTIVTIAGEKITRDGIVIAGYSERRIQSEMLDTVDQDKLEEEKREIVAKLSSDRDGSAKQAIINIQLEMKRSENCLRYLKILQDSTIKEREQVKEELEECMEERLEVEEKKVQCEEKIAELKFKECDYEKEIQAIRTAKFSDFCRKLGIPDISRFEERLQRKRNIEKSKKESIALTKEIYFERECQISHFKEEDMIKWSERHKDFLKKQENLHRVCEELTKNINEMNEKIELIKAALKEEEDMLATARKARYDLSVALRKEKQKISAAANLRSELSARRKEIISAARLEGALRLIDELPSSQSSVDDSEKEFDYSCLNKDWQTSRDIDYLTKELKECEKSVDILRSIVTDYTFVNATSVENQIRDKRVKLMKLETGLKTAKKRRETLSGMLKELKKSRNNAFHALLAKSKRLVDKIYKNIYNSESVQVALLEEQYDEPYLGGIHYDVIPPGKKSNSQNLSGGEKTIAALTLLFALQESRSSPIIIFDEVDGALDPKNIKGLVNYTNKLKNQQQIFMISHNTGINSRASTILCIAPDMRSGKMESYPILIDRPTKFSPQSEFHTATLS